MNPGKISLAAVIWSAFLPPVSVNIGQPAGDHQPEFKTVFLSGEKDYALIRTPQILTTHQGTLLVFAQGREGQHDQSGNDIIMKRSTDQGQNWTPLQVIAENGDNSLNSVCVLQTRAATDPPPRPEDAMASPR